MAATEKKNIHQIDDDDDNGDAKIFPQKLMDILSDPANEDAVCWHPNGKVFVIVNRQKFSKRILPKYFRKSKYTSFTRKLNRWNFTRLTRGRQQSTYYHEFFQKDKENLCTQMYCNNDRSKFAAFAKTKKPSTPSPLLLQEGDKRIAFRLTATKTEPKKPAQALTKVFSAPQILSAPLQNFSDQSSWMLTKRSSLPLSMNHAQFIERELQARATLFQQQENQLKTELIKRRQDELLREQQDQLLLKQEQDRQLLEKYQQQQLTQSLMSRTNNILGSHHSVQSRQLLQRQQVLEKEATCLRLQLALMQQHGSPIQTSLLNYRASAA